MSDRLKPVSRAELGLKPTGNPYIDDMRLGLTRLSLNDSVTIHASITSEPFPVKALAMGAMRFLPGGHSSTITNELSVAYAHTLAMIERDHVAIDRDKAIAHYHDWRYGSVIAAFMREAAADWLTDLRNPYAKPKTRRALVWKTGPQGRELISQEQFHLLAPELGIGDTSGTDLHGGPLIAAAFLEEPLMLYDPQDGRVGLDNLTGRPVLTFIQMIPMLYEKANAQWVLTSPIYPAMETFPLT